MNTTVYTWAGDRLSARQQSEARGSHTTQIETWNDPLQDLSQAAPSHAIAEAPDAFDFLTSLGAPPGEKEACLWANSPHPVNPDTKHRANPV